MSQDAWSSVRLGTRRNVRVDLLGTGCLYIMLSIVRKVTWGTFLIEFCTMVCRPEVLIVRE